MTQIEKLLERREILSDIVLELYGHRFMFNKSFYGSPTEKELSKITISLLKLGWVPEINEEDKMEVEEIMRELKDGGFLKRFEPYNSIIENINGFEICKN